MVKKLLLSFSFLLLVGCSSDVEIHAPDNAILNLCSAGSIYTTKISCLTPGEQVANRSEGQTALIVYIEPGDYNSNLALQDENVRLVASGIPSQFSYIKPHLRQIMINLSADQIRNVIQRHGSKYDHVYFFRSDVAWNPNAIALAFKNVLTFNKTVDVLLQVHGSPGAIALDPNLQSKMTVANFKNMESVLSRTQRDRVRAVFNSACYSAANGYHSGVSASVASALVSLFPRATTYGSYGVNYGPIHREMINFENYYGRNWDYYYTTSSFSPMLLTRTIASNYSAVRTQLNFPVFSVRGQARYFGFTKTEWQTVQLPALSFPQHLHYQSTPWLFYGNASYNTTVYTRFADRYAETDLRSPAAYLAPSSCLYQGRYLGHNTGFSEYEYMWIGGGYDGYQVTIEYQVRCSDGQVSRTQIQAPPPPPVDPGYGGGY